MALKSDELLESLCNALDWYNRSYRDIERELAFEKIWEVKKQAQEYLSQLLPE
jgi:hypothetical protein